MSSLDLYFAYGSNLSSARLRARVPEAEIVGAARLGGWCLLFDKHGRDGTAKANIHPCSGAAVWGALYRLAPAHRGPLDRAEGLGTDYQLRELQVALGVTLFRAYTYVALRRRPGLPLEAWYLAHILDGTAQHGLPAEWCERLRGLGSVPGPGPTLHGPRLGADLDSGASVRRRRQRPDC